MRIGLIGVGRIGAFHARNLATLPVVEELVISDAVPALAEAWAARWAPRSCPSRPTCSPRAWTASSSPPPRPPTPT